MANFKNGLGINNMEEVKMEPVAVDSEERAREVEFLKNASKDELKQLFREYRDGEKGKDIGMTEAEAERIQECMGKDEFHALFKEYVDDISDPKNQDEYDQYLRQLEEEGEIPADEEVVRPTPGFVLKTKSVDQGSKIFVNVCGTPKVPMPQAGARPAGENFEATGSKGNGAESGQYWSIPYIHTAMRMDQDKDRNPCHVYDILFHTDTIKLTDSQGPRFKALVIQTALESVEENGKVKLRNKEGKFDFTVMQKMTYKGQCIRPHKLKKDVLHQPLAPSQKNKQDEKPKPKPPPKKKVEEEDPTKPKMTVVHRGEIELGDYMKSVGLRNLPISRRPKELVIKLELPLMKSAADMDLDIKGGYLEFKAPNAGYNLKHKLPYPVDENTGDAKYVKAQKLLTVTLQVLPWSPEEVNAEVARAEAELAAKQAEEEKKREEEERKAAEEAKRVVKKGFLESQKKAKTAPATEAKTDKVGDGESSVEGGDAASSGISSTLSDLSLDASHNASQSEGLHEDAKPKIEDLGECVPAGSVAALADGKRVVAEEAGGEPFVSFRQNQMNVTAVVRVTGIEQSTVRIDIRQTRVCMHFSALCAAADGAADGAQRRINYAHTLHLANDVDPVHSRFDVSDTNLVLVLRKVSDTRWGSFTGAPRDAPPPVPAPSPVLFAADATTATEKAKAAAAAKEIKEESDGKHVRFGGEIGPTSCAVCPCKGAAADEPAEEERQAAGEQGGQARRVVGANGEVFEAADAFAGSRPGFVFKMGSLGLGYYTDKPLHLQPNAKTETEEEVAPTKLNPDPAPHVPAPVNKQPAEDKPMPKLPFNNTLLYDLD
jgi:dynein assembly factor 2